MKSINDLDLSLHELRLQNVKRCTDVFHALEVWSPTDWACALGGEAGEALNKVKKLRRLDDADHDRDTPAQRERLCREIAKELADTIIYADLLAARLDIDLADAVREKFNEVSRERGSDVWLI